MVAAIMHFENVDSRTECMGRNPFGESFGSKYGEVPEYTYSFPCHLILKQQQQKQAPKIFRTRRSRILQSIYF